MKMLIYTCTNVKLSFKVSLFLFKMKIEFCVITRCHFSHEHDAYSETRSARTRALGDDF